MGFIERAAGIGGVAKAVMSFRFRIPQDTISAAVSQYESINVSGGSLDDVNLPGVIPLITFGVPSAITGAVPTLTSRSFIGIACGHITPFDMVDELPLPPPRLFAYFQYDSGLVDLDPIPITCLDYFQFGGIIGSPCGFGVNLEEDGQNIAVSADAWHHGLISFDFSGGCSATSEGDGQAHFNGTACQFYWALDDVNYDSDYLWPSNPNNYGGESGGPNDVLSTGILSKNWGDGGGETSFPAGALPSGPIGFPAAGDDVAHVYNIMMADVMIFTDVSIDTGIEANRRAFITDEGRPVSPAAAIALLGKEPEVYFQTHEDWITGNNRGTAGNFTPTGTITAYSPGP